MWSIGHFFPYPCRNRQTESINTMAGVTARIGGFVVIGWSAQHQTCLCQMGFIFFTWARGLCSWAIRIDWEAVKQTWKERGVISGHGNPQRSLPTQPILWLCDSPTLPRTKNVAASFPVIHSAALKGLDFFSIILFYSTELCHQSIPTEQWL